MKQRTRDKIAVIYLIGGIALGVFCLWAMHHWWTTWLPGMILMILAIPLVLIYLGYLTSLLVFLIKDIKHKDFDTTIKVEGE